MVKIYNTQGSKSSQVTKEKWLLEREGERERERERERDWSQAQRKRELSCKGWRLRP